MKKIFSLVIAASLVAGITGCGGSDEATSTVEDANQQAIADYKATLEADQATMNADEPKE